MGWLSSPMVIVVALAITSLDAVNLTSKAERRFDPMQPFYDNPDDEDMEMEEHHHRMRPRHPMEMPGPPMNRHPGPGFPNFPPGGGMQPLMQRTQPFGRRQPPPLPPPPPPLPPFMLMPPPQPQRKPFSLLGLLRDTVAAVLDTVPDPMHRNHQNVRPFHMNPANMRNPNMPNQNQNQQIQQVREHDNRMRDFPTREQFGPKEQNQVGREFSHHDSFNSKGQEQQGRDFPQQHNLVAQPSEQPPVNWGMRTEPKDPPSPKRHRSQGASIPPDNIITAPTTTSSTTRRPATRPTTRFPLKNLMNIPYGLVYYPPLASGVKTAATTTIVPPPAVLQQSPTTTATTTTTTVQPWTTQTSTELAITLTNPFIPDNPWPTPANIVTLDTNFQTSTVPTFTLPTTQSTTTMPTTTTTPSTTTMPTTTTTPSTTTMSTTTNTPSTTTMPTTTTTPSTTTMPTTTTTPSTTTMSTTTTPPSTTTTPTTTTTPSTTTMPTTTTTPSTTTTPTTTTPSTTTTPTTTQTTTSTTAPSTAVFEWPTEMTSAPQQNSQEFWDTTPAPRGARPSPGLFPFAFPFMVGQNPPSPFHAAVPIMTANGQQGTLLLSSPSAIQGVQGFQNPPFLPPDDQSNSGPVDQIVSANSPIVSTVRPNAPSWVFIPDTTPFSPTPPPPPPPTTETTPVTLNAVGQLPFLSIAAPDIFSQLQDTTTEPSTTTTTTTEIPATTSTAQIAAYLQDSQQEASTVFVHPYMDAFRKHPVPGIWSNITTDESITTTSSPQPEVLTSAATATEPFTIPAELFPQESSTWETTNTIALESFGTTSTTPTTFSDISESAVQDPSVVTQQSMASTLSPFVTSLSTPLQTSVEDITNGVTLDDASWRRPTVKSIDGATEEVLQALHRELHSRGHIEWLLYDSTALASRLEHNMRSLKALKSQLNASRIPESTKEWIWKRVVNTSLEGLVRANDIAERIKRLQADLHWVKSVANNSTTSQAN